jgi:rfaE bifunctional protein kinase chain/domain
VNAADINQIFEKFSHMRVLVIGDAMIDTYLWGKVERISPEAPIPIVSVTRRESRLGGAANVSLNIQALGATPVLFSVTGNDENGRKFKRILEKKNLLSEGVFSEPKRKTTVKSRIISNGQHVARVDEESTEYIGTELENQLVLAIKNEMEHSTVDAIVFVDYDKGVITPTLFQKVNTMALEKGIPTSVDPKKRNFNCYRDIALFKPNFKEFVEGTGLALKKGDIKALKEAANTFKEKHNCQHIFITLSELGVFISNGSDEQHYPAVIRDIADVSGAGDSVVSVASLAMAAKLPPATMAMMANLAGGLVCEKVGVVPVDRQQLIKEMQMQKF